MMNSFIGWTNSAAERWVAWLAAASLDAAALLVLVSLVWLVIRRRALPQLGYCLFLLVPLKLLMPVNLPVSADIARWTPSVMAASWLNWGEVPLGSGDDAVPEGQIAAEISKTPEQPATTIEAGERSQPLVERPIVADAASSGAAMRKERPPVPTVDDRPMAAAPRLTAVAVAMLVWAGVVLVLLGRLAWIQWRFWMRLRALPPCDAAQQALDLDELRRRIGVARPAEIVECDDITAPAVCGIRRPTIILPRAIASSLSVRQLRWVLLHELAHVRRRDLLIIVFQRVAAILHFFNPAVWIANRVADQLREHACDDLALSLCDDAALDSAEAFLAVLRYATGHHRSLDGALGVFGLGSRSTCMLRVRRLLDAERPLQIKLGAWSLCGLMLLAAVALPRLRAADPPIDSKTAEATPAPPAPSEAAVATEEVLSAENLSFELTVLGPDKKPLPGARIELRTEPAPTPDQITKGIYIEPASYGPLLETGADGQLIVKFKQVPGSLNVNITTPGYGAYWAQWSPAENSEAIPRRFTAELDKGWSIGGRVFDEEGEPVVSATVNPMVQFKKRPGDRRELYVGMRIKTDAAGRWRFHSVPDAKEEVFVTIDQPDFMQFSKSLPRSEFEFPRGDFPNARITLETGLTVSGQITDELGKPIQGAVVRAKPVNRNVRRTTTDADGVYRLIGCLEGIAEIIVSAPGRAIDMQDVRIEPGMDPVDFVMQPGGKVRIRVLHEDGTPAAKARIFFQQWRDIYAYVEFEGVNQYADELGVWQWNEAPLDEFAADICPANGMELGSQKLIAREEEYVFRTPPTLVVTGKAIDAESGKPIRSFRVVPGRRFPGNQIIWDRDDQFTASGEYRFRTMHHALAYLLRIEADGYQAGVSRDIASNEGNVSIDVELKKGKNVTAALLTPDGKPAAGAKIALATANTQTHVANGDIVDQQTYAPRTESDATGQFHFPPQNTDFELIVTHPTGYARVKATKDEPIPETITLEAWARIEGTFQVGKQRVAGAGLKIDTRTLDSPGGDLPRTFATYDAQTGADGRFVFERVVPGKARIGRNLIWIHNKGTLEPLSSACLVAVDLEPGETRRLELGGTGRQVIGSFAAPDGWAGKLEWRNLQFFVDRYFPGLPDRQQLMPAEIRGDADKRAAWLKQWANTPEGQAWNELKTAYDRDQPLRDACPRFNFSADDAGRFQIDDMPAGEYVLSVWAGANGHRTCRFIVPDAEEGESDKPLDLGVLKLQ